MSIVLQSSGGGQITLQEPTTASNFTQTLPAATGTVALTSDVIGVNQTWTTVSGSRALSTTYTNSTGKPIMVAIAGAPTTTTGGSLILTISGIAITSALGVGTASGLVAIQAIVPNGATYVATYSLSGGLSSIVWNELR